MSSNTEEQQIPSNTDANEPQTQVSMSEEVRSVLSENVQLRENLKDTISSLDERNFSTEAEIYNLKQQNITLWANVKRENTETEKIKKEIQQLEAEYKLELVKRDELSNKNLSIRLVTDELRNYVEKLLAEKNTGEFEANKNYKRKEAIKHELDGLSQQFDSLANYLLQERQKYIDELKLLKVENEDRPSKLAHDIASKKNELMQLKMEFEDVMTKIDEKSEIILEAQKNSQLKKERIAVVRSEIIAVEKANKETALKQDERIAELQKGISALEEVIENTKNSIEQLNSEKVDVVNKQEIMKIANKSITEGIVPLKEKISSLSESEASLRNEIESLRKSIEPIIGVQARNEELTERLQTVQDNVESLSSMVSSQKAKREDLQDQHVELQQLLDSMKERSKELKDESEQVKQQYNELVSSTAETEEEHGAEMMELRETLDEISAIIKERENQILEARAVDEELSKQIVDNESLLQKCTEEKKYIEEKLQLLDEKSKSMEKTLLDKNASHQIVLDEKADEIKQLTTKIELMGNLNEELQGLEREYKELVKEKSSDLELFKETKSKAEMGLKILLKEKNKLTLTLERDYELAEKDLLEQKTKFLNQVTDLKKKIEISTSERDALSNKLSRYNQLKEKIMKQCANYERMMAKIKNELSVTKRDIFNVIHQEKK